MAEETADLRALDRDAAYDQLEVTLGSVLDGLGDRTDRVAGMATMAALLHHGFGHLWTGFYMCVSPSLLRVGPYQGTLGCLEIAVGRGVCGTAAAERRTVVVPDVEAFPGHITCDGRSASEIVVPVFGPDGELVAVFDVDSERRGTFDEADREGLERILARFARQAVGAG